MAKTLNRVQLLGNVGRTPEVKSTQGGTTVATFSLATVNRYKDGQGNWQDATEWHNCVTFGKLAEIVRDYVGKGVKLYVEGRLQTRSWDDKDSGKKQYRTEIVVSDVTLLGRSTASKDDTQHGGGPVGGEDGTRGYYPGDVISDDDVPF